MQEGVTKMGGGQLGLFGAVDEPETRGVTSVELEALATRIPPHVRFGTSSWTFPGWKGIVYEGDTRMPALTRSGLAAYTKHPIFGSVGVDRSNYAPLSRADLDAYAAQLPPGFPVLAKVWDEVTTFVFPDHPRYAGRAAQRNPRFLDAGLVKERVLSAYDGAILPHTGPFLFELPRIPHADAQTVDQVVVALDRLLTELPATFQCAFELRTPALLTPRYLDILRAHGAAHVLNFWTSMPDLAAQMAVPGVLTAPFVVSRLMLPPGLAYETAKASFAPFDRIVSPQLAMRRDVARLSARCAVEGKTLTVLVSNKAEGSAPLTVRALAEAVAAGPVTSGR